MFRYIRLLIVALVAIVLIAFSFANRHFVTVSFDPFATPDNAAYSIPDVPLFWWCIVVAALGVIAGAIGDLDRAGPLSQGRAPTSPRGGQVADRGADPEGGPARRVGPDARVSGAAAPMQVFSAEDIDRTLDFPALIDALAAAMRGGFVAPHRHHHPIQRAGEPVATCL